MLCQKTGAREFPFVSTGFGGGGQARRGVDTDIFYTKQRTSWKLIVAGKYTPDGGTQVGQLLPMKIRDKELPLIIEYYSHHHHHHHHHRRRRRRRRHVDTDTPIDML